MQLKNGSAGWTDEADSNRGRGEASRDFAKLYELDNDPKRKDFLDDLFTFMQKREQQQEYLVWSVHPEVFHLKEDKFN
ncbi:AT-rich interactive domain-containing protein 3B [Takifugu flavidus]|uniref:AT-rich interactive domain-containing protein 3B n=1 Tax=Takifugu flavidus TaxID=433684 RepID=A0A5C6NNK6_9TELE|nr:AT-rich interactive domain-containing protein 3B [Takifugu flavidus]